MRLILLSAVLLIAAGCQKVRESELSTPMDGVPAEYGELVGVTPHGARPYVTLLWFQKPDRTIVAVPVNTALDRIEKPTLTVPRR